MYVFSKDGPLVNVCTTNNYLKIYFTRITNSLEIDPIDPIFKVVPEQLPSEQIVMRAIYKYRVSKKKESLFVTPQIPGYQNNNVGKYVIQ